MNLKWDQLLKKIRTNPESFIRDEGGWRLFFQDSDKSEDEAGSESGDSEFVEEEEEEEEDEEDEDFDEDEELESLVDEEGAFIRGRVGRVRKRR